MRVSWPVLTTRTLLAAILSFDLLVSVCAIKCLQCTSLKQRECESGNLGAKQCPDDKDRYCIKYTGDSDGFVFRSCSQVEKKQCERKEIAGMMLHVCFHTCYTDGCNAAMTVTSRPVVPTLVFAVLSATLSLLLAAA